MAIAAFPHEDLLDEVLEEKQRLLEPGVGVQSAAMAGIVEENVVAPVETPEVEDGPRAAEGDAAGLGEAELLGEVGEGEGGVAEAVEEEEDVGGEVAVGG
jgi:hypothetical protein